MDELMKDGIGKCFVRFPDVSIKSKEDDLTPMALN
jgi:hypothetical protein